MGSREEYYDKRIQRHEDRAAYHASMVEQGINPTFHADQERHHRDEVSKLMAERKGKKTTKKDIGPIATIPAYPIT